MSAYAATHTAAYQQQSILTAPPGRLVVMLYDGCLRFLFQAAYAMREGDRAESDDRLRRAEAIIDELHATLDMSAAARSPAASQGIYVFCTRHLLEARARAGRRQDRQGRRELPRRAARGLGPDRRRLMDPWAELARARRARAARWPRGPLGRARRRSPAERAGARRRAAAPAAGARPALERARSRSQPSCIAGRVAARAATPPRRELARAARAAAAPCAGYRSAARRRRARPRRRLRRLNDRA